MEQLTNILIFYTPFLLTFSIISIILSILAILCAIKAYVTVKAMEKSTHTITYAPVEEVIKGNSQPSFDPTSDEEIDKQNKLYQKDLSELMPEFAPDESNDKKIISF